MPRTPITTIYTRRPWLLLTAVDPIQTWIWDDTQTWNEVWKYWLDNGTITPTEYTKRTLITTEYTKRTPITTIYS